MRSASWLLVALLALPLASAYALPGGWTARGMIDDACEGTLEVASLGPIRGESLYRLALDGCGEAFDHEAWVSWDPRADGQHILLAEDDAFAYVDLATNEDGARVLTLGLWDVARGERVHTATLDESMLG